MKLVTDEKALELTRLLLKNDKKIRDELVKSDSNIKTQFDNTIKTTKSDINTDINIINGEITNINKKIDNITVGNTSAIDFSDIDGLFD